MAFTPFVETDQPTMANFNEKFQELFKELFSSVAQTEYGMYIGTGTYGRDAPNSYTFSSPKDIFILAYRVLTSGQFTAYFGNTNFSSMCCVMYADALPTDTYRQYAGFYEGSKFESYGKKSEDSRTFYWYHTSSQNSQLNGLGVEYHVIGIKFTDKAGETA